MSAAIEFRQIIEQCVRSIRTQMQSRAYRGSNELKNAAIDILSNAGSGRVYHGHVASAPGEPPAPDTGSFKNSWQTAPQSSGDAYISRIESSYSVGKYILGELLENGTSKMAPRPHHEKIQQRALPGIMRIYSEPYF